MHVRAVWAWFQWTYRVTRLGDEIVICTSPPPPGLGQCKRGVWLLAQPIAPSNRSALSLMLDSPCSAAETPVVSSRLQ